MNSSYWFIQQPGYFLFFNSYFFACELGMTVLFCFVYAMCLRYWFILCSGVESSCFLCLVVMVVVISIILPLSMSRCSIRFDDSIIKKDEDERKVRLKKLCQSCWNVLLHNSLILSGKLTRKMVELWIYDVKFVIVRR